MDLSAEQFREIVASLQAAPAAGDGGGPSAHGQRRRPRASTEARVTIVPFSDRVSTGALTVPLCDLSDGGVGFLNERPVGVRGARALQLPRAVYANRPAEVLL